MGNKETLLQWHCLSSTLTDNKLKDTYLTLDDTEHIADELAKLQETYKTAIETTKGAKKQLDKELSGQTQTNWELEHQTKRSTDYDAQIDKMKKDIEALRSHLPMISETCLLLFYIIKMFNA